MRNFLVSITWKAFSLCFLLIFLSCSVLDSNNFAGGFKNAYDSMTKVVFGYKDEFITQDLVDSIPFASMKLKIGKGPSGLLILESYNNSKLTWVSADNVYFIVKDGRIIRSAGLLNNLTDYQSSIYSFKQLLEERIGEREFVAYYSYDKPKLVEMKTKVLVKVYKNEKVPLLGQEKNLILIKETVENSYLGWKVENKYWIDPSDAFVWKSTQKISPKTPVISYEITKKPAL